VQSTARLVRVLHYVTFAFKQHTVSKIANTPIVNSESGDFVVRTLQYSLPDVLRGHVDIVQPVSIKGALSFLFVNISRGVPLEAISPLFPLIASALGTCLGSNNSKPTQKK
jgi:hypothetical protein